MTGPPVAPPPAPPPPTARPPKAPRPPRRRAFWSAVVVAVLVTAAGVVVAVRAWSASAGPEGAVRGYFDALSRGDAATALGYGAIPAGARTYLTASVLADQLRVAGLDDVQVGRVDEDGDRARVGVRYTLGFAGGAQDVSATVGVRRDGGQWRLERAAVPTQLLVSQAVDRATVAGGTVPAGTALFFPGAVPVRFDTPYLQVRPAAGAIAPDAATSTRVDVEPSAAGRRAVVTALGTALAACLTSARDPRCPQPTERYVPGSVRGVVSGSLDDQVDVDVVADDTGELEASGDVSVRGSYRRLEFDNRVTAKRGTFTVPVEARAYATAPLTLRWVRP